MTRWAIESLDEFQTRAGAGVALEALRMQEGFLGGRVLAARHEGDSWRVQAFFEDEPEADDWLPDGMRRVVVPRPLQALLGMPAPAPVPVSVTAGECAVDVDEPEPETVEALPDVEEFEARLPPSPPPPPHMPPSCPSISGPACVFWTSVAWLVAVVAVNVLLHLLGVL